MEIKVDGQAARDRVLNRAQKLIKAIEIGAPDEIVIGIAFSIQKALPGFGNAWLHVKLEKELLEISREKVLNGSCSTISCENPVASEFAEFCLTCLSKNDQEDARIDKIIEDGEKSC